MSEGPRWLTEAHVVSLVTLDDAIVALERPAADAAAFNVPNAFSGNHDRRSLPQPGSAAPRPGHAALQPRVHPRPPPRAVYRRVPDCPDE